MEPQIIGERSGLLVYSGILLLLLLLKYLSIVVRLFGGFNNIAFPLDLTSRPGFGTSTNVHLMGPRVSVFRFTAGTSVFRVWPH
jgi:hypothetical protein